MIKIVLNVISVVIFLILSSLSQLGRANDNVVDNTIQNLKQKPQVLLLMSGHA